MFYVYLKISFEHDNIYNDKKTIIFSIIAFSLSILFSLVIDTNYTYLNNCYYFINI